MAKLFFMGDSITAGAWDVRGGWVGRLVGQLLSKTATSVRRTKGFYCMAYNLGVSGDTAPDVLRRLEKEVTTRVYGSAEDDTIQMVFAFGVNDSVYSLAENCNCYTDDESKNDVYEIIKVAQKFTHHISFIGLLPVDEARVNPLPWDTEKSYTNKNIQYFDGMIKNICAEKNIDFLPLFEKWSAMENLDEYLSDGLHPNTKGHELMAQQIGEFLLTPEFEAFHTKG